MTVWCSATTITLRLYYRPEDTPQSRSWRHGDDEVLASRRHVALTVDAAAQMLTESEGRGPVVVVSSRQYTRNKAAAKRRRLIGPGHEAAAIGEAPAMTQFFVREDYRDPLLEARDHVYEDIDI
jgi:hypothetical protein